MWSQTKKPSQPAASARPAMSARQRASPNGPKFGRKKPYFMALPRTSGEHAVHQRPVMHHSGDVRGGLHGIRGLEDIAPDGGADGSGPHRLVDDLQQLRVLDPRPARHDDRLSDRR